MNTYFPVRIVRPDQFDRGTAQTPGSERRAAIAAYNGIDAALWGGIFVVEPGAKTGIHHHGKQETIAYVLEGDCAVVGASAASFPRPRTPATLFMFRRGCRTWKSILRKIAASSGSWCAAPRSRSWSISPTTTGSEYLDA